MFFFINFSLSGIKIYNIIAVEESCDVVSDLFALSKADNLLHIKIS